MNASYAAFELPIEIVSEANQREHWAVKSRRVKRHRSIVKAELGFIDPEASAGNDRYRITLTRMKGKRQRDFDGDNLQSGFKAIRDGVAQALGIDDGSDRLQWVYKQEKGGREKGFAYVEIERL